MRLILIVLATTVPFAIGPAVAGAAPTANFIFKHGEANYRTALATAPGAYQQGITPRQPCPVSGDPRCTWEAHEFDIAPAEQNGAFSVSITWASADDDWDLYVYKVLPDGSVDESSPVASSAQGSTTQETATLRSPPGTPIEPGKYRIYVDNWAAASPEWEGYVSFEPFVASNTRPAATITGPATAAAGDFVTLDASGSTDPDGSVVNYAWDLDGDGRFDIDGAGSSIEHKFRAGRAHVSVRVRDDRGGVDFASHTIVVTTPAGGPPGTVQPPLRNVTIDVKRRQGLGPVALRGVAASIRCPTECSISARLRISRSTARRLGLGNRGRTIARRTRSLSGEGSTPRVRLKPSRRTLAALRRSSRSASATVSVTVQAEGFAPRTFARPVTIVR